MKPVALARRFLWFVAATGVAAGLVSFALSYRRPAMAQKEPATDPGPVAAEGVVCFGLVDLEHGVTSLFPLQPGRVAEVLVQENQQVKAGTDLIRLEDAALRSRLAEAEAALELGRLQLAQAVKLPEQHKRRVAQQQAILDAATSRLTAARQVHAERQKMPRNTPGAAIELATSDGHVCEMVALERAEVQRLAEINAQDIDADLRRAEHELAAAEARRDQARLALEECRVKAPRPGTVLRILVGPGDVLGSIAVSRRCCSLPTVLRSFGPPSSKNSPPEFRKARPPGSRTRPTPP